MSWVVWPALWLSGFLVGLNVARVAYQRKIHESRHVLARYKQESDATFSELRFKLSLLNRVHTKDVSRASSQTGRRHAV